MKACRVLCPELPLAPNQINCLINIFMTEMSLEQIFDQKILIEERIKVLEMELGENRKGSLIDKDGFPIANIDHYSISTARNTLNRLQVDYQNVMKEIERRLPEALISGKRFATKPFAIVAMVDRGGLADIAGLLVGDKVLMINDSITRYEDLAHFKLTSEITIKVLRADSILNLRTDSLGHSTLGARLNKL